MMRSGHAAILLTLFSALAAAAQEPASLSAADRAYESCSRELQACLDRLAPAAQALGSSILAVDEYLLSRLDRRELGSLLAPFRAIGFKSAYQLADRLGAMPGPYSASDPDASQASRLRSLTALLREGLASCTEERTQDLVGATLESYLARHPEVRVVTFGETHGTTRDWPAIRSALEGMIRSGRKPRLFLEMFQSSYQARLDDYLAGRLSFAGLLEAVHYERTWGHPHGKYRALLEFARANGLPVEAHDLPQELPADETPSEEAAIAYQALYGERDEHMTDRIAAWARTKPGETAVVFEGAQHQGTQRELLERKGIAARTLLNLQPVLVGRSHAPNLFPVDGGITLFSAGQR
jgi:hypothetical protein